MLTFNIPFSAINIDPSALIDGVHNLDGGSISFEYRIATGEKIKQNFICSQNAMLPGFSGGPVENYTQIIVTDIITISLY